MAAVQQIVRVTQRGSDMPVPDEGEIEYRSWLIYTAMREEAIAKGFPHLKDGETKAQGYRYTGSMARVFENIFPEVASFISDEDYQAFTRPVYAYLKATRNAVNISRGGNGNGAPVWWVREQWNDVRKRGTDEGRPEASVGGDMPTASEVSLLCAVCRQSFTDSAELQRHIASHDRVEAAVEKNSKASAPGMIRCPDCGEEFPRPSGGNRDTSYILHRLNAHRSPARCPHCNKEFADKRAAMLHFSLAHHAEYEQYRRDNGLPPTNREKKRREREGVFVCDTCGSEFDKQQSLAAHRVSHGSRAYRCESCGQEFKSRQARNGHMVVHSGHPDRSVGTRPVTVVNVTSEVTVPKQDATVTTLPARPQVEEEQPEQQVATLDLSVLLQPLASAIEGVVQATVAQSTAGLLARAEDAERRAVEAEQKLAKLREALG